MSSAPDEAEDTQPNHASPREYVTPQLRQLGTLRELTHGGGGGADPGLNGPDS